MAMPDVEAPTRPRYTLPKQPPPEPQPEIVTNPVAVTPTQPPTRGPIVGQGPVTESAPLNMAMGAMTVGASQWGMMQVTGGPEVLGTSVLLNLVGQLFKGIKWFPEHKGLIVVFLILSFLVSYFFLFPHAPGSAEDWSRAGKAIMHAANSTMEAILTYKADKAAGLNVMPPAKPEEEFSFR